MKNNILYLVLFIIVYVTFESIGMTLLTYYSKNKNIYLLILSCLIFGGVVPYLILKSLEYDNISTVNYIWNILSTVIMIAVGYILFEEKLNYIKILSFATGILSIFLLYLAE
jgi:multidrug transporter EmrE-like cation transporter